MGLFDNISKNVQNIGQTTVNRTKEYAEISRLSNLITDNKNKINQLYIEIGTNYCDMIGENPEAPMANLVANIRQMIAENIEYEDKLQELKGFVKCPFCQKYISRETAYCTYCGGRIAPDDVVQCPNCNSFVKKNQLFCQKCGTRMTIVSDDTEKTEENAPYICKVCGTMVPANSKFCFTCGTKVEENFVESMEAGRENDTILDDEL